MKSKRKNIGGFTLVELLVLIVIIVLLSTVIFPGRPVAKSRAREARCIGNTKQIGLALMMWYNNADRYPMWDMPWMAGGKPHLGPWPDMLAMEWPYDWKNIENSRAQLENAGMSPEHFMKVVDNTEVFMCPEDRRHPHRINEGRAREWGFWREPAHDGYQYSYGISVAAVQKMSENMKGDLLRSLHRDASAQIVNSDAVWTWLQNPSAVYIDDPDSDFDTGGWWCNTIGYFHGNSKRATIGCRDGSARVLNYGVKGKGIDPNKTFFYGYTEDLRVFH